MRTSSVLPTATVTAAVRLAALMVSVRCACASPGTSGPKNVAAAMAIAASVAEGRLPFFSQLWPASRPVVLS
jgi:hypothetical protein